MGFKKASLNNIKPLNFAPLFIQTYESNLLPEGVVIIQQKNFTDDFGGSFKELGRINSEDGMLEELKNQSIEFNPRQINRSKLTPGTKRFWHIHPNQNEIWTLADGTLNLGLIDLRKDSRTFGLKIKIILDEYKAVYIPHGIAHGFINSSSTNAILIYITDMIWKGDDQTEEFRIDPKDMSYDFVKSELM